MVQYSGVFICGRFLNPLLTHLKDRVPIPGIVEKIWKNLLKIATIIGILINRY